MHTISKLLLGIITLNTFFKIGKYLLRLACVGLATLIPKRKDIWVFGGWFGKAFSDNPKYMYQYLVANHSIDITSIWIGKDSELVRQLKEQGVNAHYHNSLAGIYYQLIAKVVFVSHSISSDLNPWYVSFNTKRIQLWHGIPLKKIGFDDHVFTSKDALIQRFPKLFSLLTNDRYDLITSAGEACTKLFSSAFNLPLNKIVPTGFPRNDVFFATQDQYKAKTVYKVIYMPTFRGDIDSEFDLFDLFGFDAVEIDKVFDVEGIELTIRTHPANKPTNSIISKINNSKNIKLSTVSDVYEEITSYDCLITDYSSIMFDFSLSKKDILFAPFDLEKYLKDDRKLYFSYSDILGGIYFNNWPELITGIIESKNSSSKFKPNAFINSFHDDLPVGINSFSQRVYNITKSLL